MDPNNLHPDVKARLDTVMNTPTNIPPPPIPVVPNKEDLLVQKQDANQLRMPSSTDPVVQPIAPVVSAPIPPASENLTVPSMPAPQPMAVSTPLQVGETKKKSNLLPFLLFFGGIIFFGAYTVVWVFILMPQIFSGGN